MKNKPVIGVASWRQTVEVWGSRMSIFQLDESYINRVRTAGGLPVLIPHLGPDEVRALVGRVDALILTGGDDVDPSSYGGFDEGVSIANDPVSDQHEIALVKAAVKRGIPVLGICRGAQIINIAYGGTLIQEVTEEGNASHPPRPKLLDDILGMRHPIRLDQGSKLADIFGTDDRIVNTTHHQAILDVADGFRAVAWAPDGTIEAIESADDKQILAVQWHPEKLPPPTDQELFDSLVESARSGQQSTAAWASSCNSSGTGSPSTVGCMSSSLNANNSGAVATQRP